VGRGNESRRWGRPSISLNRETGLGRAVVGKGVGDGLDQGEGQKRRDSSGGGGRFEEDYHVHLLSIGLPGDLSVKYSYVELGALDECRERGSAHTSRPATITPNIAADPSSRPSDGNHCPSRTQAKVECRAR